MLPFDVKKYTTEQKNDKAVKCSQQSLANRIVLNSVPERTNAQPIQQKPAKQ